jgi:hypothetical protein
MKRRKSEEESSCRIIGSRGSNAVGTFYREEKLHRRSVYHPGGERQMLSSREKTPVVDPVRWVGSYDYTVIFSADGDADTLTPHLSSSNSYVVTCWLASNYRGFTTVGHRVCIRNEIHAAVPSGLLLPFDDWNCTL